MATTTNPARKVLSVQLPGGKTLTGGEAQSYGRSGSSPATTQTASETGTPLTQAQGGNIKPPVAGQDYAAYEASQGFPQNTPPPHPSVPPVLPPSQNPLSAPSDAPGSTNGAGTTVDPYKTGLAAAQASGVEAPQSPGAASTAVQSHLPPPTPKAPDQPKLPTTPSVDNFFQTNPGVDQISQTLIDQLSPPAVQADLFKQMKKITGEQNVLGKDKLELMNMKRVMEGTEDDLRDEVTKANGFATESQIQALTIGRNKTLLKQASFLQDQVSIQQDLIANDTSLLNFEKDMANTQFSQRMSIMQYQQSNNQFIYNATQQTFKNVVDALGYDGAYEAYKTDPVQLQRMEAISGLGSRGLEKAATTAAQARVMAQQKEALGLDVLRSNLATDAMQRANIGSEIAARNAATAQATSKGSDLKSQGLTSAQQLLSSLASGQGGSAIGGSFLNRLGSIGDVLSKGTGRADFVTNYDNLKALLSLDNVKYLKGQGQVSDAERALLEKASSQLSRNQSPDQFKSTLRDIVKGFGGNPNALNVSGTSGGTSSAQSTITSPSGLKATVNQVK